jgi:hypothetical protein
MSTSPWYTWTEDTLLSRAVPVVWNIFNSENGISARIQHLNGLFFYFFLLFKPFSVVLYYNNTAVIRVLSIACGNHYCQRRLRARFEIRMPETFFLTNRIVPGKCAPPPPPCPLYISPPLPSTFNYVREKIYVQAHCYCTGAHETCALRYRVTYVAAFNCHARELYPRTEGCIRSGRALIASISRGISIIFRPLFNVMNPSCARPVIVTIVHLF